MRQNVNLYTDADKLVWKTLFERQVDNLQNKCCAEYLTAVEEMSDALNPKSIASFQNLDAFFETTTGWKIHCVPGLIPVEEFFQLLAQKKFCSSTWLRRMDQLDYLEEPDMFHDIFGHVPLLANPIFSDFMEAFGKLGVKHLDNPERVIQLQRLYWFTIEFGLIDMNNTKVYGAGIVSSYGETNSSLQSDVEHIPFNVEKVLNTPFRNDVVQDKYFVIDSFDQLFKCIEEVEKLWG